ncbi:UDP-glucose 4-epimerase [Ekhidna lutea]|uniref:UDP-glucose 4-epimerase n=1 Tax=Ekhidna lutea TaxID=447679 RepID=A0A239L6L8_EKHLU|nr:SDR family oxidoreductase [Ekhidna lutea]SNT26256.1 UDP-glucose 4-epimerase [Ekhidna lutea]
MKVLITGGAGYVGTKLVKHLVANTGIEQIIVYDNLSKGHHNFFLGQDYNNKEKIQSVRGDILDTRQLKKLMKDADVVVHLAAIVTTPFANTDPHFYEQVNHWGTAEVVYCAEESDISKFIYLSSTSVYGASEQVANESTTPAPSTFYGISKLRGEEHVNRLAEKKNAINIRGGNVYGYSKSMRFDAVINRFMFDANFTNRIQINGNGKQSRAFIHVDYLCNALAQTISKEVPSGTYNLVDKNLQILDIVDVLKEIYPSLEFLFTNQHMNLRELKIDADSMLFDYIDRFESDELKAELEAFKGRFAF